MLQLDVSFGEDRSQCGDECGGIQSPCGLDEEVCVLAEEEISETEVGSVTQSGNCRADLLLGLF